MICCLGLQVRDVNKFCYNHFTIQMHQSLLLQDPKRLLPAIVLTLKQILSQSQDVQGQRSIFDLKNKPTISFPHYLMRIFNFMGCSLSAYLYSLILIDKIIKEQPSFKLTQKNIHRVLFTSIVLSAKFIDDHFYKNNFYASVGGIPINTLNQLEQEMLSLLNYHCPIDSQIFNSYLQRLDSLLQQKIQHQKNRKRPRLHFHRKDSQRTQPETQNDKRKVPREKRQRSREKVHNNFEDTQESRQIEECE